MTKSEELSQIALKAGEILRGRGWRLATVESCTGGWVWQVGTALAGRSGWVWGGPGTFSNATQATPVGGPGSVISSYGAVSGEVAEAMVSGALERTDASVAVSVTGIAGPGGGSEEKPVGTVYMAWQFPGGVAASERFHFHGDREEVRRQSVTTALLELARRAEAIPD